MRKLLAASAGTAAMLALTACAGSDGQAAGPAPTVTVTTTVTAPAPTPTPTPTVEETTPTPTPTPTSTGVLRFIITCSVRVGGDDVVPTTEDVTYDTLQQAWADKRPKEQCSTEYVALEPFKPTKLEAQAIKVGKEGWGLGETAPDETIAQALTACATFDEDEEAPVDGFSRPFLQAAAVLCPKAPHIAEMRLWAEGRKFYDGEYEVGKDIPPGTYRTQGPVSDCYWERTTSGGETLANDFVTHAPKGVTVRIRASDGGFVSKECGLWTEVE